MSANLDISNALIFAGSSNPKLAHEMARLSGVPIGSANCSSFPDSETSVKIFEDVSSKDCFIVQSLGRAPNDYLMELFIMADALKRASAKSIIAVVPYMAYSRQDRKLHQGEPITSKLVASLLEQSGIDSVITMDIHSEPSQGFFQIPFTHLRAANLLLGAFEKEGVNDFVVAAPDVGSIKLAKSVAEKLDKKLVVVDKKRSPESFIKRSEVIGDVSNKHVLFVDDICSTASTLISASKACKSSGALSTKALISHGLFSDNAVQAIKESPLEKIYISNTLDQEDLIDNSQIKIVSIAPLFSKAIQELCQRECVTSLLTS